MIDVQKEVARNIRRFREMANMTQEELAARLDVTPSTIANYEAGTSAPRLNRLAEICSILSIEPSVIMGLSEPGASLAEQRSSIQAAYDSAPPYVQEAVKDLLKARGRRFGR